MTYRHQAQIMDGTSLAQRLLDQTADRASAFRSRTGRSPCLAAVLVGDDPSSVTYVEMKQRRCRRAGVSSRLVGLASGTTTSELVEVVEDLSRDPSVDGILLQHPVPTHVDERKAFEAIRPDKDVDGVTMHSFAAMAFGLPGFSSCTPAGIMRLLDEYQVDPAGRHAVVIGRSPILGKPAGMLLMARDATVTYCHSHTRQLPAIVGTGDIVVAAVGKAGFVRGHWLQPGSVVIDAGYSPGPSGDVDFDEAVKVCGLITPVPGGVGPMTIAMLIDQTVTAAEQADPSAPSS